MLSLRDELLDLQSPKLLAQSHINRAVFIYGELGAHVQLFGQ